MPETERRYTTGFAISVLIILITVSFIVAYGARCTATVLDRFPGATHPLIQMLLSLNMLVMVLGPCGKASRMGSSVYDSPVRWGERASGRRAIDDRPTTMRATPDVFVRGGMKSGDESLARRSMRAALSHWFPPVRQPMRAASP